MEKSKSLLLLEPQNFPRPSVWEKITKYLKEKGERRAILKKEKIKAKETLNLKKLELAQEKIKAKETLNLKKLELAQEKIKAKALRPSMWEKITKYLKERKELRLSKPGFWERFFNYLREKNTEAEETLNLKKLELAEEKTSKITWFIVLGIIAVIICGMWFLITIFKSEEKTSEKIVTTAPIDFSKSIESKSPAFHYEGEIIQVQKDGYQYERIGGKTYWNITTDHLIFVSTETNKKYYLGPNGWETEFPNSKEEVAIPPPTLSFKVYPNKNYGCSSGSFQISKITDNR